VAGMAELEGFDCGFGEQRDLIDLFDVVVFGGEPEDGDVVDAGGGGCLLGASDGGGGLEQGKQRAAEEADLLAGDDGAGAGAEFGDVGEGCGSGGEASALPFKASASSVWRWGDRRACIHALPRGSAPYQRTQWRVSRALGHRQVVAKQLGRVRQRRDGITLSAHQ
jgi:hypothetical protein